MHGAFYVLPPRRPQSMKYRSGSSFGDSGSFLETYWSKYEVSKNSSGSKLRLDPKVFGAPGGFPNQNLWMTDTKTNECGLCAFHCHIGSSKRTIIGFVKCPTMWGSSERSKKQLPQQYMGQITFTFLTSRHLKQIIIKMSITHIYHEKSIPPPPKEKWQKICTPQDGNKTF